jgi:hypothetical protein
VDRPVASAKAQEQYESVAAELPLKPAVTAGRMMGMPTL